MVNFPRQIGLMYTDATRELGEAVSNKLFKESSIILNQLTVGLGESETAEYGESDIEITTSLIYDDTHLTHIVLQSDEAEELNEGVRVSVDEHIGQLFDNVRLGIHLIEECSLFDAPEQVVTKDTSPC